MASIQRSNPLRTFFSALVLFVAVAAGYYFLTKPRANVKSMVEAQDAVSQLDLVTWNLFNFGRSKDDTEIAFIASKVLDFDVVAVQEVSTGPAGAQAVGRLADALGRTGAKWDYRVSDPTTGPGSERYAYLWKPSRLRLFGRPWLAPSLAKAVDREPFLARFRVSRGNGHVLLANFHAVPTSRKPAVEIRLLSRLQQRYPDDNLLIMGDFNLSQKNTAFDMLKVEGFVPAITDQRTSLKMRIKDGRHLANEYDNIFYEAGPLRARRAGVIDFTSTFPSLRDARHISDHLPVFLDFTWN